MLGGGSAEGSVESDEVPWCSTGTTLVDSGSEEDGETIR